MNRDRQKGMTMLGWVIVLAIIGIFAIAILRVGPLYLEYYKINSVLASVPAEMSTKTATKSEIQKYLGKRFDIEAVTALAVKDVKITRKSENFEVRVTYDARTPFIGNLNFIITFDKAVEVPR